MASTVFRHRNGTLVSDFKKGLKLLIGTVSREVKQLIDSMLEIDPTKRITAGSALRHPWVSNRDKVAQAVHRQVFFQNNN